MNDVCMIICHFNDPHLPHAIASLKKQTNKPDIVLVDDGFLRETPKGSKSAVRHISEIPYFAQLRKDIQIIEPTQTRGIGYAREIGLKYAIKRNYELIGFLDSDGIAHRSFVEKAVAQLQREKSLLGVCARKGIANPRIRVAKLKYRYKIYKKDDFQLDCSLFKAKACINRKIPDRIAGEDSVFILSFKPEELSKLNVPFYHFERETVKAFFRDEYYGAYHSYKTNRAGTFTQFLFTPHTSLKMILRNRWIMEGLLFPFRQLVWFTGYLRGSGSIK